MNESENKKKLQEFFDVSNHWRDELYIDQHHPFNKLMLRRKEYAMQMIDRHILFKKLIALDIGCGPGAYIEDLIKRGFDVFGVDISQGMLDACKTRLRLSDLHFQRHFKQGDIEQIPFDDNVFNLVVCTGVLGNLVSDDNAIGEINRVLGPNGWLLLAVENVLSLSNIDYLFRLKLRSFMRREFRDAKISSHGISVPGKWITEKAGTYYKLYNPYKFNTFMKAKGFQLIESRTVGNEFRILRRRRIIPESSLYNLEIQLENFFHTHHVPYFSYAGQFYIALFKKINGKPL